MKLSVHRSTNRWYSAQAHKKRNLIHEWKFVALYLTRYRFLQILKASSVVWLKKKTTSTTQFRPQPQHLMEVSVTSTVPYSDGTYLESSQSGGGACDILVNDEGLATQFPFLDGHDINDFSVLREEIVQWFLQHVLLDFVIEIVHVQSVVRPYFHDRNWRVKPTRSGASKNVHFSHDIVNICGTNRSSWQMLIKSKETKKAYLWDWQEAFIKSEKSEHLSLKQFKHVQYVVAYSQESDEMSMGTFEEKVLQSLCENFLCSKTARTKLTWNWRYHTLS